MTPNEHALTLNDYQMAALETSRFGLSIRQMVSDTIPAGLPTEQNDKLYLTLGLCYCGLGLGEAGEVQGNIKKFIRDDLCNLTQERKEKILMELGDLLWYIANLADILNTDLSAVAEANIVKLTSRDQRNTLHGEGDNR